MFMEIDCDQSVRKPSGYRMHHSVISFASISITMMNQETIEDNKVHSTKSNYTTLHESETESTLPQLVEGIPAYSGIPNQVKVVSPSDLPEGYQFSVVANHRALIVSVVSKGPGH
jgi:hypothetical protein